MTKERPILFSAPMVRAILAGKKTQTRRIAKQTAAGHLKEPGRNRRWHPADPEAALACPYGQPGTRLWVREAHWWFKDELDHSCGYYPPKLTAEDVEYRADGDDGSKVWRPSIHTTTLAIQAARAYLALPDEQPSTNAVIRKLKPICADFVSFRAGYRAAEREHKIGEQS